MEGIYMQIATSHCLISVPVSGEIGFGGLTIATNVKGGTYTVTGGFTGPIDPAAEVNIMYLTPNIWNNGAGVVVAKWVAADLAIVEPGQAPRVTFQVPDGSDIRIFGSTGETYALVGGVMLHGGLDA
jgi:hypothetical protein